MNTLRQSSPGLTRAPQGAGQAETHARLLAWGWPADLAEATAARAVALPADDDRVLCVQCAYYRPTVHRCAAWHAARLKSPDVGRDLAVLPQRCPGFSAAAAVPDPTPTTETTT